MNSITNKLFSKKTIHQAIWLALLIVSFVLISSHPVLAKAYNLSLLIIILSFVITVLYLSRKIKSLFYTLLVIFLFLVIFSISPSSNINTNKLHKEYVRNLNNYKSVPYYWGGENNRGIDCSGLPRKAIRNALFNYSVSHLNPNAFREYIGNWWYDVSAHAISQGYRGYAFPLNLKGEIRQLDYTKLKAGDLAITQDGLHLLIFNDHQNWIQADPFESKVTSTNGRTGESQWFDNPIAIFRWKYFK